MRKPALLMDLLSWHRQTIAGLKPPITHEPQVGWFTRRLVKGGTRVPARIWLEQETDAETGELLADERLHCEVGGKERDAEEEWLWLAANPISESEFKYLTAQAQFAKDHTPLSPEANPHEPVKSWSIPRLF